MMTSNRNATPPTTTPAIAPVDSFLCFEGGDESEMAVGPNVEGHTDARGGPHKPELPAKEIAGNLDRLVGTGPDRSL